MRGLSKPVCLPSLSLSPRAFALAFLSIVLYWLSHFLLTYQVGKLQVYLEMRKPAVRLRREMWFAHGSSLVILVSVTAITNSKPF